MSVLSTVKYTALRIVRGYIVLLLLLVLPILMLTFFWLILSGAVSETGEPYIHQSALAMVLSFQLFGGSIVMHMIHQDFFTANKREEENRVTIFRFALKRSFSNKTNLIFLGLFPIACIFLPQGENGVFFPYGYQYFGILLMFAGIRLASLILEDRVHGVVKRLAVAPVSHLRYLSQNLLAFSVILALQCAIVVYGGVLYGHELYKPHLLLLLFVSFSFVSLAVALAWISLYRVKETAFLVYMSLIFLVVILGGLLIPLEIFPDPLRRIAVILPTYWLVQGLNGVASGGSGVDFLLVNAILWLYTLVFAIAGSKRKIH